MSMRHLLLLIFLAGAAAPAIAQTNQYHVEKTDPVRVVPRELDGKKSLWVTVRFKIVRPDGELAYDVVKDEIVINEDGRPVQKLEVDAPGNQEPLTVVLAIDKSGSMAENAKIDQAKRAARLFLDKLHPKTDCGLILFDHQMRLVEKPCGRPERLAEHREQLHRHIEAAKPSGGTAYLDAAYEAVQMLKPVKGRKAVVLLTDGVDLNSQHAFKDVVIEAALADVRIYTLGVGEPGLFEPVTMVLVLDHSGSMKQPADDYDEVTKLEAMQRAASRFVELMRPEVKATLLPFNSQVPRAEPFTDDREGMIQRIRQLKPRTGTRLYDATFEAVATIDAENAPGRRAIVVLTDGQDEGSRRRVEDVIRRSRDAKTPVHMLGLGRPRELNEPVMKRIASDTGGSYHHASNQQRLLDVFEALATQIHDDRIDEKTLRELAEVTGGKYLPARKVEELHLIYRDLAEELQTTWTARFPSQNPSDDGTVRAVDIAVWRDGVRVSDIAQADYQRPGVVPAEMSQVVYLVLLTGLGVLLAIPVGLRRLYRFYGGT